MPLDREPRGRRQAAAAGLRVTSFPARGRLGKLLRVAFRALAFWPPLWPQSILGAVRRWAPRDELSDITILDPRRPARALGFLSRILLPAAHGEPPRVARLLLPRFLRRLLWRSTTVFEHPAEVSREFPAERWFYINGVATNEDLARINATLLARLFHRPLRVIQNATHSLVRDLWETVIGKGFRTDPDLRDRLTLTEAGLVASIAILDALCEPGVERVVVIAHSQGTVITANVLRAIARALELGDDGERRLGPAEAGRPAAERAAEPSTRQGLLRREMSLCLGALLDRPGGGLEALEKLEIYTFANCADTMKYVAERDGRRLPVLEHFANERDSVARLGILSPFKTPGGLIDIDGPVFVRKATRWPGEGWGHFLNDAYLLAIRDHLEERGDAAAANPYPAPGDPTAVPRLYGYLHGASPG